MTTFGFTPAQERAFHNHVFLDYWNTGGLDIAAMVSESSSAVIGSMEYAWDAYLSDWRHEMEIVVGIA